MKWQEISFLQKRWIRITALITANLFTLGNFTAAIVGIVLIVLGNENYIVWFGKMLAICSILDFTDGKLARIGGSKKLAVDVDTLVDTISFGLFPATFLAYHISQDNIPLGIITGFLYLGAAWYRLFRFIKRDPMYTPYFQGLPSSFAAMVLACLVLFEGTEWWVVMIATVIVSGFMISRTPFPSFKGVPGLFDLFWIVSTTILILLFAVLPFTLMVWPAYGLATVMIIYLMFGPEYAIKLEKKNKFQKKETSKEEKSKEEKSKEEKSKEEKKGILS